MITITIDKSGDRVNIDASYDTGNADEAELVYIICQAINIRKAMDRPAKEAALIVSNSFATSTVN